MNTTTKVFSNVVAAWNTRDDRGASRGNYVAVLAAVAMIAVAALTSDDPGTVSAIDLTGGY